MPDARFFSRSGPFTIEEIAKILGCELIGKGDKQIKDVAPLESANEGDISFVSDSIIANPKYKEDFKTSKASVCIIGEQQIPIAPPGMTLLVCDNTHVAYAAVVDMFYPKKALLLQGKISSNAFVSPGAKIAPNVTIEDYAYIEDDVEIGEGSYISSHVKISKGVKIGKNTHIAAQVTIEYSLIGDNVIIHPGVRIGQDGFGFAIGKTGIKKVQQLGRVIIGNNVEIGANSCIDRGAVSDTMIGDNTKIDNLVQIGHGVVIGRNCLIVAQVGIAGSTVIGDGVMLGGQSGILGHITIGNGAKIAAKSGVISDVGKGEAVGGYPSLPIRQWHRLTVILKKMIKNEK